MVNAFQASWEARLRYVALAVMSMALVGCGSSVKLDEATVESRSPVSTTPAPSAGGSGAGSAQAGGAGARGVTGVEVGAERAVQPEALKRVVYFDFDSYEIRPEFTRVLEVNARYATADRSRKLALEGHTDERGGREYNLALGQKRADAVRRALVLLGVPDAQMEAVSFGKEKPAAAGSDEAAHAQNRRVELVYR